MVTIDLAGQDQRRAACLRAAREMARGYFTPAGAWAGAGAPPETREWLWTVFALLAGDPADVAWASSLVLAAPPPGTPEYPFCVFANNHAAHLLAHDADRFSAPARARLESWARQAIQEKMGSRQAALQFHGYNDNMPAKATLGMILGGEYFGDRPAVEQGLWNLHQLRLLLARRGVISEHCSPTYSPLTLTNLAEIAALARSEEARTLAGACAERLWCELLAHYHAPTRSIAGPFSRAYATDSAGHLSALHFLLWLVFGAGVVPDPLVELSRRPPRLVVHHSGDVFFVLICLAFVAACRHEPPAKAVEWMAQRQFPFRFAATTERGEGGTLGAGPAAWPASPVTLASYQTSAYALGTSNGDWISQAERWHLVYRRTAEARDWADVRHLTLRYLADDDLPGRSLPSPRGDFQGEADFVVERGLHHTVQADSISLVVSRPVPELAGKPLRRLGLAVIIPEHLNRLEDLRWEDGHLWLRDGPFRLAVRPLGVRRWASGTPEVVILGSGPYRVAMFPNHLGGARAFAEDELRATTSGFVAIAGSAEGGTEDKFRARVLAATLTDYIWNNQRIVQWRGCGHALELSYGVLTNGVRHAVVDGRAVATPPWEADGLPFAKLPLAGTGPQANPWPFPFRAEGYRWTEFPSVLLAAPGPGVRPAGANPAPKPS